MGILQSNNVGNIRGKKVKAVTVGTAFRLAHTLNINPPTKQQLTWLKPIYGIGQLWFQNEVGIRYCESPVDCFFGSNCQHIREKNMRTPSYL
ncbi:hypothetical protein HYPP_02288 [Hyphomicrobium sp. ghe19]|nr:hypothetical protein HYPP_02288 [Hyphomicrobium sp. ghe19]